MNTVTQANPAGSGDVVIHIRADAAPQTARVAAAFPVQKKVPAADGQARAFTIVEALVVVAIIALLAGILLGAVKYARTAGDAVAELGEVSALHKGVEQYKQLFDQPVPLVVDTLGGGISQAPINLTTRQPVVWGALQLSDPDSMLNGRVSLIDPRKCYSELSLAYYLVGALDKDSDGVDGVGYTDPKSDGTFSKTGRKYDPIVDPSHHRTRTGAVRLVIPLPANSAAHVQCRILDRWSDGTASNSYPIRYYRWQPSYYPQGTPKAGQVQYWNVPIAAGGNANNTMPPIKSELKSAEYAIVSAGPDHLFGDEPDPGPIFEYYRVARSANPADIAAIRARAVADNIVESGR